MKQLFVIFNSLTVLNQRTLTVSKSSVHARFGAEWFLLRGVLPTTMKLARPSIHPFFERKSTKRKISAMAEFDASGFSEFDRFFGGNDDSANAKVKAPLPVSKPKAKRGGVGAVIAPAREAQLTERLLRVGTKRSREEDGDEGFDTRDDVDLDEGAGRTGIASKENKSTAEEKVAARSKKLGKKERNQIIHAKQESSQTSDSIKDASTNSNTAEDLKKTKPKRRKIRSRQKNIRKDTRKIDEKPQHLRVGGSNYKGRPLTEETRTKLSLPPSKSTSGHFYIVDRSPAIVGEEGVALGVEDFLEEPSTNLKKVQQKSKEQKKKKKYKNL